MLDHVSMLYCLIPHGPIVYIYANHLIAAIDFILWNHQRLRVCLIPKTEFKEG